MKNKMFYGWRIVYAGMGIQFMQTVLLSQAFGAYVAVLVEEKGWSKTALSGAAALQSVEAAILGPLLGWMVDRMGAKTMIRIGVVLWFLGLVLLSQIETIGGFYAAFVLIAIGTCLAGFFPVNVTVIQWFSKYRGRALSMVGMGLGLGGIFMPALGWSMDSFGWRHTAMGSAILALIMGLALASVFRRRPEEHGLTVDGLPPEVRDPSDPSRPHAPEAPEFTARQAMRTSAFWLIGTGHACALLIVTAVNTHAITHMKQDLGYSLAEATLFITLMTFFQLIGNVTGVLVGDHFDKRKISAACMIMHGTGLLFLTYATGTAMLILFGMLHGMAWGLRGPFMQALRADYFGRNAIGMIMGISALITVAGQVAGPMVAGAFADYYGNYEAGFTVLGIIAICGSILFLMIKRPEQPQALPAA